MITCIRPKFKNLGYQEIIRVKVTKAYVLLVIPGYPEKTYLIRQ